MRTQHFFPLLVLSVFVPGTARSAWLVYGNAIAAAPYDQTFPVTVADGAGGAFVAWRDDRNGGGLDIYAQRVDGSGAVQWTAAGVAVCIAPNIQSDPQIVSDGAGGVILAWTDDRNSATTGIDLYVQRLNALGVAQWTTNGVPVCTAAGAQQAHRLISDGAGGALIIWADGRNPYGRDVYVQRVNASGIMQWTADGVALCTASQDQFEPLIVSDMAGGGIGIWRDWRNGQHGDIYARRFNAGGEPQWTPNGVSLRGTDLEDVPRAAVSDGAGGAIVISIDANDIHAQRVSSAGVVPWGANGVGLCNHWSGETDPTCIADGEGGAIVAWKDLRDASGDIYAQRVDAAGVVQWWPTGEWVCAIPYAQDRPRAVTDGNGGVIVTWFDLRNHVSYDIYAQRLNSEGDAQWPANGVALTLRGSDQKNPVIAEDGAGGGIVSWQDVRELINNSYYNDIYARRVSHGGMVLTGIPISTPTLALELRDNYPNPFSTETTFDVLLHRDLDVRAEVFDAAGRRVRAIHVGHREAGVWQLRFDGLDDRLRSLPSGVYFFRVYAGGDTVTRKMVIAR